MNLQAKFRLLAFSPTRQQATIIRDHLVPLLKSVGLKVSSVDDRDNVYPTVTNFEFEDYLWTISIGEIFNNVAHLFVIPPVEVSNAGLRLFTRTGDWSGVEKANEMTLRCLSVLKDTGVKFVAEAPNPVHRLFGITATYKIPRLLKASFDTLCSATKVPAWFRAQLKPEMVNDQDCVRYKYPKFAFVRKSTVRPGQIDVYDGRHFAITMPKDKATKCYALGKLVDEYRQDFLSADWKYYSYQ
jgi:hypothetical protein